MSENIVFIDSRVAAYESLIENPAPETTYYLLEEGVNGIDQMQRILSGYSELQSIQIVSHGSVGTLSLGGSELNINNLGNYTNQLESIGSSLIQTGDILLYGCNVAQRDDGAAFLNALANMTSADVSASSDTTGNDRLNADWNLEVNTGSIEALNLFNGQECTLFWNGTLEVDNIAPTAASFSPLDGATGVTLTSNITVTFSEPIQRGTGAIELRSGSATGSLIESYNAATSNRLIISGATLTIDPTSNLTYNTQYFLTFANGTIKDLVGNNYVGTSTYDFATPDTAPPTVASFSPLDGATGVTLTSNITVTFSEPIQRGTGAIELRSGSATGTLVESYDAATSNRLIISGATLTIDPTSYLTYNTQYFLTFASGTIKDLAGQSYAGTSTYDFATHDTLSPTVASFSPVDGAAGVTLTSNITVTFNESIQRGTGTIELRSGSATGTLVESFNAASSNRLTISGALLTIDPTSYLSSNTHYFLIFANGTIKDIAGNNYAGTSTYDFTTLSDSTPPVVTSFNPLDGVTGAAVESNITVTFNESIQPGTGTIELRSGSATGSVVESFNAATSNRLTISGATLTIDPTSNLTNNTHYFLIFANGTIKDIAGNNYAGTSTYDFTTLSDSTPPVVTSFNPLDGVTGVAVESSITVTFNESIQRGTGTIELRSGSATGTLVESFNAATSNRMTISGATLTIDPTSNLTFNTHYFLTFASGTIKDITGNNYAGTLAYDFTTLSDSTPPSVTSFSPPDGATGVTLTSNINLTFSESIQRGTGAIELRSGSATGTVLESFDAATSNRLTLSGATLTIDPTSYLASNTHYFLTFAGSTIKDIAGNNSADTSTYDFTTLSDSAPPTVTSFNPLDGDTGVVVESNITFTFNESIQRGTGTIELRSGSASGTLVESFNAATSNLLTLSGALLTIDPTSTLAINTQYFLYLPSGTIKDIASNNYAGTSTYDFTTGADTTPPAVASFNPLDGATGVALTSNIAVTFNESIQRGTGAIELRSGSATGTLVESYDAATSNRLIISGATLTIDPTSNLTYNAQYFLTFASGTIKDLAGQSYAGTSTYDFATHDTLSPTVTSFSPVDGAAGVTLTSNITVTFNESIQRGTGTIELRSGSATGTLVESFNAASSNRLTISGALLTIDPTINLSNNNHYFLTFASGSIKDVTGNNYAGTSTYDFTTPDTTPPTINNFSPSNGAIKVPVRSSIKITFTEAVDFQTGIIQIHNGSATGTVFESFDVTNSTRLLLSGNTLIIDPLGELANSSDYYVTFPTGFVKDSVGNNYAETNSYHFTTAVTEEAASASSSPLGTVGLALAGSAGIGLLAWLIL